MKRFWAVLSKPLFLYSVFFTFPSLSLFCIVVLREILLSRSVHFKITHSIHYTDFIASISKWFFSHFNISLHITQLILFTAKYIFFLKTIVKQIEINDSSTFFFFLLLMLMKLEQIFEFKKMYVVRCTMCDVRWKLHVCNMKIWIFIIVVYPL